jgi:hypothetical protein
MGIELTDADRRHAADQLGVPADADPADARSAFLRRLPAAGFCPPPPLCAAAATLAGQPIPGAAGVLAEPDDEDLAAEVDAFSREFWTLRPDIRRGRWQDLLDRSTADPRLSGRVRRLEAGVDLRDATGVPGPQRQREVVGMIQTLFVMRPIDRAARRRELLDSLPPPAAAWEQAARHVERDLPAHAALEPAVLERLSTWSRRVMTPAAAAVGRPAPTWGFQTQGGLVVPQVRRPARPAGGRRVPVWTLLWAFILFARLVSWMASPSPSHSTSLPVTPAFTRPTVTSPAPAPPASPWGRPTVPNGPEEHSDLDRYMREIQDKSAPPSPAGRGRP